MPATTIPVTDTLLFSELAPLYDGAVANGDPELVNEEFYSLIREDDIFPMERSQQSEDVENQVDYLPENYGVSLESLRKAINGINGRVMPWRPNTVYYPAVYDYSNNLVRAGDVVFHENSLYLVKQEFISGTSFDIFDLDDGLALDRISLDSYPSYVEITANIKAPILSGDEIGSYVSIRETFIHKTYTFPNAELAQSANNATHVAYCNPEILTPCTVTIMAQYDDYATEIGEITFTPATASMRLEGVFTFNDALMFGDSANILRLPARCTLLFVTDLVDANLDWIRINMLAMTKNYLSYEIEPALQYYLPGI